MYFFLISGHKAVYLSSFILLFFYFVGKNYSEKGVNFLFCLVIFLVLSIIIDKLIIHRTFLESIFIRRVFFTPALLNDFYFEFFDEKPVYLSHSIFKSFFEYPYELKPPALIADKYFGSPESSANNGIIADGFLNFGTIGIVIYLFIFSLIFAYFNSIEPDIRYFGIFFLMTRVFIGSALLTIIKTHGLWLLIIFAVLIMRRKTKVKSSEIKRHSD
jgi:hypothetical protein